MRRVISLKEGQRQVFVLHQNYLVFAMSIIRQTRIKTLRVALLTVTVNVLTLTGMVATNHNDVSTCN